MMGVQDHFIGPIARRQFPSCVGSALICLDPSFPYVFLARSQT
jgi:hypothetical protein